MCASPITLQDRTVVACRHCGICRSNRINDLVGRSLAEQALSSETLALTLTYAGDTPESTILRYRDVQNFLKYLRVDGYSVRYIVAGEYGTAKGRAHWHIILFFRGSSPELTLDTRQDWKYWPHGFVYPQRPDYRGFAYALKYALKDEKSEGSSRQIAMSKKPPLGHDFFVRLANDLITRRIPVHNPEYSFANVRDRNGKARRYWLNGRMREIFLETYVSGWLKAYGEHPPQTDWLVERYLDKIARKEMEADPSTLERDIEAKRRPAPNTSAQDFLEGYNVPKVPVGYLFLDNSVSDMVTAYPDETATLNLGEKEWTLRSETADATLRSAGLSNSMRMQVCQWLLERWNPQELRPELSRQSRPGRIARPLTPSPPGVSPTSPPSPSPRNLTKPPGRREP